MKYKIDIKDRIKINDIILTIKTLDCYHENWYIVTFKECPSRYTFSLEDLLQMKDNYLHYQSEKINEIYAEYSYAIKNNL